MCKTRGVCLPAGGEFLPTLPTPPLPEPGGTDPLSWPQHEASCLADPVALGERTGQAQDTEQPSEVFVSSNVNSHVYDLPLTGGKLRPISGGELVAELELAVRGHSLQAGLLPREGAGRFKRMEEYTHPCTPGTKYTDLEHEGLLVCPSAWVSASRQGP